MVMVVVGIVALVVIFFVVLLVRGGDGGGSGGPALQPGTRAWEASLTMGPLLNTIEARKLEMANEQNQRKQIRLTKEIAYLEKQIPELQAIIDAKDTSPGRGYIGFDAYKDE